MTAASKQQLAQLRRQRERYRARVKDLNHQIRLLSKSGPNQRSKRTASATATSVRHDTELIQAVESGDLARVRVLLEKGANPNAHNRDDEPVLLLAVSRLGNLRILRELLKAGARIDATDGVLNTPLIAGVREENVAVVKELIAQGANVDAQSRAGDTPLTNAACWGSYKVVKLLLDNGADPNLTDGAGVSASELARQHRYTQIVEVLVRAREKR